MFLAELVGHLNSSGHTSRHVFHDTHFCIAHQAAIKKSAFSLVNVQKKIFILLQNHFSKSQMWRLYNPRLAQNVSNAIDGLC